MKYTRTIIKYWYTDGNGDAVQTIKVIDSKIAGYFEKMKYTRHEEVVHVDYSKTYSGFVSLNDYYDTGYITFGVDIQKTKKG